MHGLYLLWWVQERQLSAPVVATILAAGDLALLCLEVPTGWFADRYGHRTSLIAGSLVQVLGMVFCWLGRGIPDLIAASVLVALGDAFRSGADQALLYRTCQALDCEATFQRIEARTRAVELAALVGLVLAGGAIVETWGFSIGWIVEAAMSAAGLGIACVMKEPPACLGEPADAPRVETMAPRIMVLLILPAAFLGGVSGAASFLAQTAGRGDPAIMTLLVAGITLAESAGSTLAMRLPSVSVGGQTILATAGVLLIGIGLALPSTFLSVVVALSFLLGIAHPLRAAAIQRLAADAARARAASVASACDMAFTMIALPLAGFWRVKSPRRK